MVYPSHSSSSLDRGAGMSYQPPQDAQLWIHSDPTSTRIWEFKSIIERKYKVELRDYEALRQWSITCLSDFWSEVWHFTRIRSSAPFEQVAFNQRSQLSLFY